MTARSDTSTEGAKEALAEMHHWVTNSISMLVTVPPTGMQHRTETRDRVHKPQQLSSLSIRSSSSRCTDKALQRDRPSQVSTARHPLTHLAVMLLRVEMQALTEVQENVSSIRPR